MNEFPNTQAHRSDFHRRLLTTASILALLTSSAGFEALAADENADHPTIWIELGGQLEQSSGGQEIFTAPFLTPLPKVFVPIEPFDNQRLPKFSYGVESKVSFEPDGAGWIFSAGFRYGRSNRHQHRHNETPLPSMVTFYLGTRLLFQHSINQPPSVADVVASSSESHAILDFQAGKDAGLGLIGQHGISTISFGVRLAQFNAKSAVAIEGVPTHYFQNHISKTTVRDHVALAGEAARSFQGVGPSIAWDASAGLASMTENSGLTFDWGMNAALLFGRQKANVHHQSSKTVYKTHFIPPKYNGTPFVLYHHAPPDSVRNRNVIVPNLGGFAGLSFKFANSKVSLGYRADFFFGAIDGGIDVAKNENRGFFGPFATVSVGLGG